jgi:hypothetical protein
MNSKLHLDWQVFVFSHQMYTHATYSSPIPLVCYIGVLGLAASDALDHSTVVMA